jgi:hypothetical protein
MTRRPTFSLKPVALHNDNEMFTIKRAFPKLVRTRTNSGRFQTISWREIIGKLYKPVVDNLIISQHYANDEKLFSYLGVRISRDSLDIY